jgi:predicted ATP-binding protein involved in virulence
MRLLQESFPKIQFIASTHSPLVASGSEHCKIVSLRRGRAEEDRNVYGWLPEDVYREIMGLSEQRPSKFSNRISRYGKLYEKYFTNKQLSPSERREFRRIGSSLVKQLPESDPVTVTTKIRSISDFLTKAKKTK